MALAQSGLTISEANADRVAGKYQVVLPVGENYSFRAEAPGYIAVSDRIDLGSGIPWDYSRGIEGDRRMGIGSGTVTGS